MYFQCNVVQLSSSYIPVFDAVILNIKEEYIKIAPSRKWKFSTSFPLQKAISEQQYHLKLFHLGKKMVMGVTKNKVIAKF